MTAEAHHKVSKKDSREESASAELVGTFELPNGEALDQTSITIYGAFRKYIYVEVENHSLSRNIEMELSVRQTRR